MSDTLTSAAPADTSTSADDLEHMVCCRNDDIALCGTDVSEHAWSDIAIDLNCVVCVDLHDSAFCPLDGRLCPIYENDE